MYHILQNEGYKENNNITDLYTCMIFTSFSTILSNLFRKNIQIKNIISELRKYTF